MNKFIIFDYNKDILAGIKPHFENIDNVKVMSIDVRKLISDPKFNIDVIVSPANSYGFMRGGIDAFLSDMFLNIEFCTQKIIKNLNVKQLNNKPILPVGSAILVDITDCIYPNTKCKQMISAPTMETPMQIDPKNIYYVFYAILKLTSHMKNKTIAVPGLGTACGGVSFDECGKWMKAAYDDFNNGIDPNPNMVLIDDSNCYVTKDHAIEQIN